MNYTEEKKIPLTLVTMDSYSARINNHYYISLEEMINIYNQVFDLVNFHQTEEDSASFFFLEINNISFWIINKLPM